MLYIKTRKKIISAKHDHQTSAHNTNAESVRASWCLHCYLNNIISVTKLDMIWKFSLFAFYSLLAWHFFSDIKLVQVLLPDQCVQLRVPELNNQRPVFRSRDHNWPIRDQYYLMARSRMLLRRLPSLLHSPHRLLQGGLAMYTTGSLLFFSLFMKKVPTTEGKL